MARKRTVRRALVLAAAALLALGAAACGGDDDTTTGGAPTSTAPGATTAASATTAPGGEAPTTASGATTAPPETTAPVETPVNVYFLRDEKMAAAGRTAVGLEVAREAVEALLDGPHGIETEIGMTTSIPDGTELLGLDIDGGAATIDLSGEFASGGGTLSMTSRVAQVVFTLTQFPSVESVTINLDGEPATEGIGGEGVDATDLTRADFADVTPAILVESPTPGQVTPSPLTVRGSANVFEGTVTWNLTDNDGLIVEEGFVTAAMGEWMPFEFTVDYDVARPGLGAIILFEVSPEDGSQTNVVEIPIELT